MDISIQRQWEVQWHEGMLLSPQHFQQQQRYYESERVSSLFLEQPYYWGIYELAIRGMPAGNPLSIERLYGVMPDGLIVNYFAEKDPPLEINLDEQEEIVEGGGAVPVHLAVPIRTRGAASHREAAIRRFDSIDGDAEVDENTGEGEVAIARLRPKLELLATAHPSKTFVTMPLFQVSKELVRTYKLAPYMGPMLRMPPRDYLDRASVTDSLCRLVDAIREKALRLDKLSRSAASNLSGEQRRQKQNTAVQLTSALPPLEVLLRSGRAHPWEVYQALSGLVGNFAQFRHDDSIPPRLPRYRHDMPLNSICVALKYLSEVVENITVAFSIVPFDTEAAGRYSLRLTPERMSDRLIVVLHSNESDRHADMRNFAATARIATESAFPRTLKYRILGARRTLQPPENYLHSDSRISQAVIEIDAAGEEHLIVAGEKLIIASSDETPEERLPSGVSLYVTHESG